MLKRNIETSFYENSIEIQVGCGKNKKKKQCFHFFVRFITKIIQFGYGGKRERDTIHIENV